MRRVVPCKVPVRVLPFQRTDAPLVNPVPSTVKLNAVPPAGLEFGLIEVIVGPPVVPPPLEALTVKDNAFESPPPGAGLNTATEAVPEDETSAAEIAA